MTECEAEEDLVTATGNGVVCGLGSGTLGPKVRMRIHQLYFCFYFRMCKCVCVCVCVYYMINET